MNTDTIEITVIVLRHNSNWIARTVDFTFIAQGISPDSAIDCLVGCIEAQYSYDKSKNIEPLSKHKTNVKLYRTLYEKAKNKYIAQIPPQNFDNDVPSFIPQLAYA